MVRKALKVLSGLMAVVLLLALPTTATAATVTPYDGNISSTYTQIFEDILAKKSPLDNYVMLRSGQYDYVLYIGQFTYDNDVLAATEIVTKYIVTTYTNNYNSRYVYDVSEESNVTVVPGDAIVYSDLGDFPTLQTSDDLWSFAIFTLLMILVLFNVIRWVSDLR